MIKVTADLWFCLFISIFVQNDLKHLTKKLAGILLICCFILFIGISCFIFRTKFKPEEQLIDSENTMQLIEGTVDEEPINGVINSDSTQDPYHKLTVRTFISILICSVNSLILSIYVLWKCFSLLNLKIGAKNTLGYLRYEEDIMLGSIAIFQNGGYLMIFLLCNFISYIII